MAIKSHTLGGRVKLDLKDKKIVSILSKNARVSVSDISRKTGIPRDSVLYRIKRLQRLNMIRSFTIVLNPPNMGYPLSNFVIFTLHNFDEKKEKEFRDFLEKHPNVTNITKTSGKWDYTVTISAKNVEDFDKILREIRSKFADIIKDHETAALIKEYKDDAIGLINP